MVDALAQADRAGLTLDHATWVELSQTIVWLCDNWSRDEAGIWETRGGPQPFTYGRLMTWVAFDRAVRLATARGRPADLARWVGERDRVYREIMEQGFDPERGAFVQHYGSKVLDASLLKMPLVGFIAPDDPMWLSTLTAIDQTLVSDSLVYRYDPAASPDGLRGSEGTFSMCTFWYVQALARSGRLRDARIVFEKMHTYANHLGLFSEEIGPTGEQLGNFPQAFSHLALINTATLLADLLDRAGAGVETTAALR
jgi:GH15 family glucan-1,4-alpha-glucosidase